MRTPHLSLRPPAGDDKAEMDTAPDPKAKAAVKPDAEVEEVELVRLAATPTLWCRSARVAARTRGPFLSRCAQF